MTRLIFDATLNCVKILPVSFPDADDFPLWGRIFLNDGIEILEFNEGADRHQIRFNWQNYNFNLNFEHYSESIWINAEGLEAEIKLSELQEVLQASLS